MLAILNCYLGSSFGSAPVAIFSRPTFCLDSDVNAIVIKASTCSPILGSARLNVIDTQQAPGIRSCVLCTI